VAPESYEYVTDNGQRNTEHGLERHVGSRSRHAQGNERFRRLWPDRSSASLATGSTSSRSSASRVALGTAWRRRYRRGASDSLLPARAVPARLLIASPDAPDDRGDLSALSSPRASRRDAPRAHADRLRCAATLSGLGAFFEGAKNGAMRTSPAARSCCGQRAHARDALPADTLARRSGSCDRRFGYRTAFAIIRSRSSSRPPISPHPEGGARRRRPRHDRRAAVLRALVRDVGSAYVYVRSTPRVASCRSTSVGDGRRHDTIIADRFGGMRLQPTHGHSGIAINPPRQAQLTRRHDDPAICRWVGAEDDAAESIGDDRHHAAPIAHRRRATRCEHEGVRPHVDIRASDVAHERAKDRGSRSCRGRSPSSASFGMRAI